MRNYKSWVKEHGKKFIESKVADFEQDKGKFGGATEETDFLARVDEHDQLVTYAAEIGKDWSLAEITFVNSHSPNKVPQAVSKTQAIDAFVRDISRTIKQAWKQR